jgi:hypothetical protein
MAMITAACILVGCGTTSTALNKISLGMTKPEVIKILGNPHTTSAKGQTEYLTYNLENEGMGGKREFFVRLINGNVDAFGRSGDFDTTSRTKEKLELSYPKADQTK